MVVTKTNEKESKEGKKQKQTRVVNFVCEKQVRERWNESGKDWSWPLHSEQQIFVFDTGLLKNDTTKEAAGI